MSQADRIILILGDGNRSRGVALLSEITGVSPSGVHRWSYPKGRGGSGGHIPVQYHQSILDGARAREISLSPADFFDRHVTSSHPASITRADAVPEDVQ
jgi:hypothetical protein